MRKLYKNKTKSKISGVCQGLAEYFDIDPSIVRIGWALLTIFTSGLFLIVYIVCAIILPDKTELEFNDYSVSNVDENKE
ncbi:MAG: PspC domain-containing protein [Eubacteriales bacterium]